MARGRIPRQSFVTPLLDLPSAQSFVTRLLDLPSAQRHRPAQRHHRSGCPHDPFAFDPVQDRTGHTRSHAVQVRGRGRRVDERIVLRAADEVEARPERGRRAQKEVGEQVLLQQPRFAWRAELKAQRVVCRTGARKRNDEAYDGTATGWAESSDALPAPERVDVGPRVDAQKERRCRRRP